MAGATGIEPATSDVTGRRSNQLNYAPFIYRSDLKDKTYYSTPKQNIKSRLGNYPGIFQGLSSRFWSQV